MKNNIKSNMVSLKSLKAELEAIKQNSNKVGSPTHHTNTFGPLMQTPSRSILTRITSSPLFIITLIIAYAHKIPGVSKIINNLSKRYGRTSWWKLLGYIRKAFVIFNAIVGFFALFPSFDFEISIDGFKNLFNIYLNVFKSLGSNTVKWVLDKLDLTTKQPNLPGGFTKEQIERIEELKRQKAEHIKILIELEDLKRLEHKRTWGSYLTWIGSSGDNWIPSWLLYGGVAIVGAGVLFVVYKFITDPYGVADFINPNKNGRTSGSAGGGPDIKINDSRNSAPEASTSAAGATEGMTGEGIAETVAEATSGLFGFTPFSGLRYLASTILGSGISRVQQTIVNTLNPFNYTSTSEERANQFKVFLENQNRNNTGSDIKLYPFTPNNPYAASPG
uniref:Uncharacterized protein n=1 Tax=Phanerochaete carnosa TaxID=231932 RepID=A0A895KTD3_9APHY|nr:hypothetical protein K8K84_mgp052 [Phanerochaete carnosa]QRZ60400.1 hypothetical protein [Phanerochaete carnosa]